MSFVLLVLRVHYGIDIAIGLIAAHYSYTLFSKYGYILDNIAIKLYVLSGIPKKLASDD